MLSSPLPYAQSAFCFPSQRLPRGVSERPPLWGEPRPECGGPDWFQPEWPGQQTRPSSHSALRRPGQGGAEWPCGLSPLGPISGPCALLGVPLFKPLELSLGPRCLWPWLCPLPPRVLELTQTSGVHHETEGLGSPAGCEERLGPE